MSKNLVTHETGPAGRRVRKVLVEQGLNIERELYVGMVLDRARSQVAVIGSPEGGVEIEEVAARSPEKIFKELVDPLGTLLEQPPQRAFTLAQLPVADACRRRGTAARAA